MTKNALADFPYLNTESHYSESTTNHDETKPPSGVANHQNTESYSAAAKKRRSQNTRIPNRTRGRATDRRVQWQSPTTPGSDHDPARLPARTTSFRIM